MHTIRLRGPWKAEVGGTSRGFDWEKEIVGLLEGAVGTLILRRRFNRPTGLGLGDEVQLSVVGLAVVGVRLNDSEIALPAGETRIAISENLQPSNQLEIVCSADGSTPVAKTPPLVQLEIASAPEQGTA